MNILSLEEKLISNNWLIVGKLFLILLQIITSSADEPSTSKIQNSKAGWTIAANNSQHHSKSNNSYEQKWGQSRIYTFEGQNLNSQSNSSVPRLMAWQEWQKMQQMRNYDREESMRNSTRGPFLLILADGQKAEKRSNKTSGYLPAEAEEEVAEEESPTRGNKEKEWQGTAYSATDVISRIDKDPNLATRSISSQVLKTTTLSTVDQLNNQNSAGPGLLFGKPAGIIQPEQPAAPMDFRQLPSLMLLLKQIPTVIRSFNENQLSTAEHKGAAQSWNGGLLPFSAAGNGLLQGLLGTTLEDQPPTTAVQQSKIPVQNGGYSEDKNHAAKIPTAFWEGGENPKVTGVSSLIKSLSAEQQMHQQHQMSLAPAIRPIVPVVTTHGNEMAGQIEIRRLQNKQSSNKYEKEKTAIGSGNAGKMIKLGSKERQQRLKIYGAMPAPPSTLIPATTNSDNDVKMRRPRPQFDMGKLTVGELGQLERIHRKLFNDSSGERKLETDDEDEKEETENIGEAAFESRKGVSANHQAPKPLNFASHAEDEANLKAQEARTNGPDFVPASSPRSSASNMAYLKELVSKGVELGQLDQGILNDLLTVGELPDLEQLTSGMDLGLLQKPGGFSILKQQFVQRLIQRAYGNGFSSNNSFKFS